MAARQVRDLAANEGLRLAIPECPKGIGEVIREPGSPALIEGVKVQPFALHPDDRGYFLEVQRLQQGLAAGFPPETTQISAALNYLGTIKAFHFHLRQTDLWSAVKGMLQVTLVDFRAASPTFGRRNTLYVGALRPWQILIPPGVGHGYKVVGSEDALLVYLTNRLYDPADEGRVPFNDPSVNYDWDMQWK